MGGASVVTPAAGADGCRKQWTDLASLHGENGNPEGSATVLVERWDTLYDEAWQLAETATPADCGLVIETFARKWGGPEPLMYDLHPFDMPLQLAIDEGDRRHWTAAFVEQVAQAAQASKHYRLAVGADRFIDDAELSEE